MRLFLFKSALAIFVFLSAALTLEPAFAGSQPTASEQISQVLAKQQAAWNHHDLEGFMQGYWHSRELTFFAGGQAAHGWQEALDRYKHSYQSDGHEMGTLELSDLDVQVLGPSSAFVRGTWTLTMPDGKKPHGLTTLIFQRFPEGWKIVHDHSCTAE